LAFPSTIWSKPLEHQCAACKKDGHAHHNDPSHYEDHIGNGFEDRVPAESFVLFFAIGLRRLGKVIKAAPLADDFLAPVNERHILLALRAEGIMAWLAHKFPLTAPLSQKQAGLSLTKSSFIDGRPRLIKPPRRTHVILPLPSRVHWYGGRKVFAGLLTDR
jgi:hypothetical protein